MDDWKEYTAKTVEEAVEAAKAELGDKIETEVVEEGNSGFLFFNGKQAKIRARVKVVDLCAVAKTFLNDVLSAMGITAEIEAVVNAETETVEVQLIGDDMGILIGKRGQTLDSLQYLLSLVINKETENYTKVKLDTENYRERRKETLENLAKNISMKVKKTHKTVSLEPMNPYERRIIHSALQDDKYVDTHSEGEEPNRKVVITPKKGVFYDNRRRNNGRFGGNRRFNDHKGGYNNNKKVNSSREFHKKYGADTNDYSTDYKKDYAAYLESKAAAKASSEGNTQQ